MKTIIACGITSLLVLTNCARIPQQQSQDKALVKIELVSANFDILTRSSTSFERLWSWAEHGEASAITITEPSFLSSVSEKVIELGKTLPDTNTHRLNNRLACLLYRADGKIDSLSFDRFNAQLNTHIYVMYRPLLLLIAERLPGEHRQAIQQSIQRQDRLKEREINDMHKTED